MPTPGTLAAFAAASFLLIIAPGPSMLFVVGRAVAHGRRTAVRSALGNAAGELALVATVAVGIGALVAKFTVLFTAVKLIGATYLVYLGVRAIRRRRDIHASLADDASGEAARRWRAVWDGAVVGATNPKSLMFFVAALPQFVDPAQGAVPLQLLVLGSLFVVMAAVTDCCSGLLAGTVRQWLLLAPRRLEITGAASGVVMIGLGAHFALTGRKA